MITNVALNFFLKKIKQNKLLTFLYHNLFNNVFFFLKKKSIAEMDMNHIVKDKG